MRNHLKCLIGTLALVAACGGGGESPTNLTPVTTSITITPASAQLEAGLTLPLTASVRDQNGATLSRTVTWATSSASIATVDQAGVVRGITPGTATISASVDGKTGNSIIVVTNVAVASVALSGSAGALVAGQTAPLTVLLKDKNGNTLTGRQITWTTSNRLAARVDANGVVTGLSPGTSTITATSEGISGTLAFTVTAPPGAVVPTVSSISPAVMTAGGTVTIAGTGFGATAAQSAVFVNGVEATVSASTPTQITAVVPTTLPCQSTRAVGVDVVSLGGSTTSQKTLQVATQRALAVGGSFTALSNALGCNELPSDGTYIVSIFNASPTFNGQASFELRGLTPGLTSSSPLTSLNPPRAPSRNVIPSSDESAISDHFRRLEETAALFRTFRKNSSPVAAPTSGGLTPSRSMVPVPTTVGATTTINYNFTGGCANATTVPKITARVVYVGPKVIVLEDNTGGLAGKIDNDLIGMAKDFENVSLPILTANFGNPLAFDDSTDHNGRMIMMFTPRVNAEFPGSNNLLGFVNGCDLLSARHGYPGSNSAEIFYARAVTDTTPGSTSLNGRSQWRRQMPSTLIHETKHIISYAERFQTPVLINSFEETWIEEATAQLAAELYGRAIHGNGWKTDSRYAGTVDKEVCLPPETICDQYVHAMRNHFGWLNDYLQNFESKSIIRSGTDGSNDDDIYGSSWLFTRWLVDTYATDEANFTKAMTLNYNVVGVANVTATSGKTWAELLSQFTLMLAADNLANVPAVYQELSWDLPSIYTGFNKDFGTSFPAAPLAMRQTPYGTGFQVASSGLRGGGAIIVKISGSGINVPQLLDMHSFSGGPLPQSSTLGLAVLRVQ